MTDIFADGVNKAGNIAGVFEADHDVSFFYLYKTDNEPRKRIIGAIQIMSGEPDFTGSDIEIFWYENDNKVGLFIKKNLWAYFDLTSGKGIAGRYPTEPLKWSL